ncbi:MAG: baseplate J/gp47 family protein, partial [Acidimicrobiales bacterium]
HQLIPPDELLARIAAHLEPRRTVGARVVVEAPVYQGVTVVARALAKANYDPGRVEQRVAERLYRYLHPLSGGPEGTGWPFGRPVQVGELYAVLQRLDGVDLVQDLRVFGADPITGVRGTPVTRLEVATNALVFSYEHQVKVEGS